MWSLGLLPEEALEDGFAGPTIGFECSGTVIRKGPAVTHLELGDRVIAMAPACFASHVTVSGDAVIPVPRDLSLIDAATIPVAFLTAYYALEHLAHIRPNDWVLIHGAAGGVGLAAVQVAKRRGAKVIATAGNDEKRALLTFLGADYVLDTRSLEFSDEVRRIARDGVDIVLNSLAGEAMERSLELVRPFGRFLELGKRDFYSNTKIGLRPLRRNISYFGIDADQLLTHRPDVAASVFRELGAAFDDGAFSALPYRLFDSSEIVDAFRLMQKSGHVGKIVVTPPPAGSGREDVLKEFKAASTGTHIIIGGTSGFGLEMARWLADRGATRILLSSRSGGAGHELEKTKIDLESRGISLNVVACDVTDELAVEQLLQDIRETDRIAGVALTAMVLDDALIQDLTPERIRRVLAPKVTGAQHLDRLTENDRLDYFILFSSAAAMFGNPGQGNYVAANGYLDGLARERRRRGKTALSVAWGAITDVGVLTRQQATAESLARHTGGLQFTARDGLNLLGGVLAQGNIDDIPAVTLAAMNWSMANKALTIMSTPAYALIRREATAAGVEIVEHLDLRKAIEALDDNQARKLVAQHLAAEVASIFRMPIEDINLKRSLSDLGMDSLMGLELSIAAERNLGIHLPMVSLSEGICINDIAAQVLANLRSSRGDEFDDAMSDRSILLTKHVSDDIDPRSLDALAEAVEQREQGLENVI